MKIKLLLTLIVTGALSASAQSQGFKDGVDYYKAGQVENAKTILDRTLNDPATDKAVAHFYLGQVAMVQKDLTKAKAEFDKGVAANAENPLNYVGLGAICLHQGNEEEAKEYFKQAQKIDKKNTEITVAIARAYYHADPIKYAKDLAKQLEKAHKDSKHANPSIYILEGDMLFDEQDYGGAAAKYEMAINYDNANPEGYVKYANAYFKVNPKFAIEMLHKFLEQAPHSALAQRELAEKYYMADLWTKASELYGHYMQNPNHFPEDKPRYAVLLYANNQYEQSLAIANEVLAKNPDRFGMQRLRFLNEAALKRYDEAIKSANEFFTKNPGGRFTTNDYITLAGVYQETNQDSLAIEQYEIAIKNDPENIELLKDLSSIYSQAKNYVPAAQTYEAYVNKLADPSRTDFLQVSNRYLNAAAMSGDNLEQRVAMADKGISYIDKAIEGAEPNPILLQRKGRLYIARNNNKADENAANTYKEMIAILDKNPENANPANQSNMLTLYREGYMFITQYLSEAGDNEQAAQYMEKYTQINDLINGTSAQN